MLSGIGPLCVCTRYRGGDDAVFDHYPYHQTVMHNATCEYERVPGWDEDISDVRDIADLPQTARDYLAFIADFVGVPVGMVGVGPGSDQIAWTDEGRSSIAARTAAVA